MSDKPSTAEGYSPAVTLACERALVTLLRGLGTLKPHLRLIGGLVPRYLTPARPPDIPEHAGTMDVDVALDLGILAGGSAYRSLRDQLKAARFQRACGKDGVPVGWRWQREIEPNQHVVVEFLTEAAPGAAGGRPISVAGEAVSALPIPHCSIVQDWYREREVTATLLDGGGTTVETVRHADFTAFMVLKAIAIEQRFENKDAADLMHVLQYGAEGDLERLASEVIARRQEGRHGEALNRAFKALRRRFCTDGSTEGYLKDGPASVARFHRSTYAEDSDERVRLQRDASALVTEFLRLAE